MRFAIALVVGSLTLLGAQTSSHGKKAPPPEDDALVLPVITLTVTGNENVPSALILKIAAVKVGDPTTKETFEAARQRLVDTGFFESVGYRYEPVVKPRVGYAAKIEVREVRPLYRVLFAGLPGKDADIAAYLKSRDPLFVGAAPPTKQLIDRWAGFLDAWTASQNQPKKVIGKLVRSGTDNYVIQFQPDEPLPAVARVEFSGNEAFEGPQLQKSIGMVAYGLPYTEQNFRDLLEGQLKPMYEAKGYLRVHFEDISTEPAPLPVKGLVVRVKIVEGPVFRVRRVRVTGVNEEEQDAFLHLAGIKAGTPADFDQVNKGIEKMRVTAVRAGYNQAAVEAKRDVNDTAKTVDITFKVDRGAQYTLRTLTIQGLDIEGENAIRKMWGEKLGDPYNPDYPKHFLKEVHDAGMFDYLGETKADVKTDDQAHAADVTLVFNAEKPEDREKQKKKRQEERNRPSGSS